MSKVAMMSVGRMRVMLHSRDCVHTSIMLLKSSSVTMKKQHCCMLLWKKQGPSWLCTVPKRGPRAWQRLRPILAHRVRTMSVLMTSKAHRRSPQRAGQRVRGSALPLRSPSRIQDGENKRIHPRWFVRTHFKI
ncbi:uncharacterized protein LOC110269599 [Arachis ipaensis]|uniref:uncharacterized protein LOC110269599 n=1 Tax=Arachis ipaensis TaxID=130454 RepID=UPI000A2B59FA|nr:uncharacterized protein LOC110269599 [Arachis ipaensis]